MPCCENVPVIPSNELGKRSRSFGRADRDVARMGSKANAVLQGLDFPDAAEGDQADQGWNSTVPYRRMD